MTDDELSAVINNEIANSLGSESDKLSRQRSKSMEYYLGEPYGNENAGKSSVVTREVMDTIEWVKPELMKIFASGTETVRFEPTSLEDVPAAQQATDYINYLFHRKNPGFKIIYEWITDGLLQKNGIVKAWYDSEASNVREDYKGLTELELQVLLSNENIELIEQVEADDGVDVAIKRKGACSGLKVEVIPPEEFIISRKGTTIVDSPFCAHTPRMTISDLNAMGFETEDLSTTDVLPEFQDEYSARHGGDDPGRDAFSSADETMREVRVVEAYIRLDYDGDGIAELRKVMMVGNQVLTYKNGDSANEEVDCMPFAGWTPIIISHKFDGLSLADLVMDLQVIQSQLLRNMLDNQYLTNNGRYVAVEGMVNLDDLLTSRPHGVVRTKMAGAVSRLDTPQLGQTAFQMLDYVDRLRERRTGVSERSQGLDPNALAPNTAATAVNQVMTAAQQRIELIARVFGETGLTDLFRLIHKLVIQNQTSKDIFRLRDQYVEVDPSEWRERKDTSVVVGLGNGSRESEMMQLNLIFQNQMALSGNPATAGLVEPINLYNTLEDQVKVFNKASAGRHFTDPTSDAFKQSQQQKMQQQMQQMQKQEQFQQMQMQMEQMRLQLEQMRAANKDQNEKIALDIKQQAQDLDVQEHADDTTLRTAELQMEATLESQQERPVALG